MLDRPPFAVISSLDAPHVGAELVACFAQFAGRSDRLEHAHKLVSRSIGMPETDPRVLASRAIARDIDRGVGAGVADGYHNSQHFLEVMLSTLYLSRLSGFNPDRATRVVTAALMHDFHHDGSRASASPFFLERLALQEAQPYLLAAGVDDEECDRLQALVLATDPIIGVPFARSCRTSHFSDDAVKKLASELPLPLGRLVVEPELAYEAVLLCEADVLPSIGLTVEHAKKLQSKLAAEWGMVLGAEEKLQFIECVAEEISVASFFIPNIEALRHAYRGMISTQ